MINYDKDKPHARLIKSLELLFRLEYGGDLTRALHIAKGEQHLTYKGIYELANPHWAGWDYIRRVLSEVDGDMRLASARLEDNEALQDEVERLYRDTYWARAKLSYVESQKIADEIFIFGVNVGMRTAIRKAQKLVGVKADGIVGDKTIEALNSYDVDTFDMAFDTLEKDYYDDLIEAKPYLAINENGWRNRANYV